MRKTFNELTAHIAAHRQFDMAVNELSGVERVYGVAAVDRALPLRSGRKLIKLSER